jgi:DNA-binding transcriptional LysR family regulator
MQQLEEVVGFALFEPEGRGIKLTDAGRRLLEPARDLLARADSFEDDARAAAKGEVATVRIGFVSMALGTSILPEALGELRARRPDARIELRHARTSAQLEMLEAGDIDLALVHARDGAGPLPAWRLRVEAYALAVQRQGPLARGRLDADALGAASWIAIRTTPRARERWLAACAGAGFTPHVAVEVSDYPSALALVEVGMGVCLVPESQEKSAPSGVVLRGSSALAMSAELWLVQRRGSGPLADEMVRILRAGVGARPKRAMPRAGSASRSRDRHHRRSSP